MIFSRALRRERPCANDADFLKMAPVSNFTWAIMAQFENLMILTFWYAISDFHYDMEAKK